MALRWKLGQATSAYTDATGQNPAVNALDMLVLVTMARMVVEEYGIRDFWRRPFAVAGHATQSGDKRVAYWPAACSNRHKNRNSGI